VRRGRGGGGEGGRRGEGMENEGPNAISSIHTRSRAFFILNTHLIEEGVMETVRLSAGGTAGSKRVTPRGCLQ
jgi:hypothetical protein